MFKQLIIEIEKNGTTFTWKTLFLNGKYLFLFNENYTAAERKNISCRKYQQVRIIFVKLKRSRG